MYPNKEKCVVHFNLSVDFNGFDYSNGNDHATNGIMTQQWNKCARLTNNAKCNLVKMKKHGMPLHEMHVFPSNDNAIIPKWKPDYKFSKQT